MSDVRSWRRFLPLMRDAGFVLAIYFVFHTFAYAAYYVPSGSMRPTLEVGDRLMVSKFAYGFSGESLPVGMDFGKGRILERMPKRGDVVVFDAVTPDLGETTLVKRVIGLPGDTIQMISGRLWINGHQVPRRFLRTVETQAWGRPITARDYEETLPGGRTHIIREFGDDYPLDNTAVYHVPAGHVFFMGDDRDYSADSRPKNGFGMVPMSHLIGRADIITFSLADCAKINEDHCHWGLPLGRYASLIH